MTFMQLSLGPEDSHYLSAVHARYVVPGRTLFVFRTAYMDTTANDPWRSRRGLISHMWIAQHQRVKVATVALIVALSRLSRRISHVYAPLEP